MKKHRNDLRTSPRIVDRQFQLVIVELLRPNFVLILAGKIRCKQLNSDPISCQGFPESQIYLTKPKVAQDWAFTYSFMP